MENQAMSSSGSSTPEPEKLKGIAMEKGTSSGSSTPNLRLGSPQEVTSESRIETPCLGSSPVVPRGGEIMRLYPSKSNKIFTCPFCKKDFPTLQAFGGHQNAHKKERELDKKRKKRKAKIPGLAFLNTYLDKPHLLFGGYSQDALSNENHLGITLDPCKRLVYPSFNSGVTGGTADMNMTVVPRMTPTRFFTGSTDANGSASRVPYPSPNNNGPSSSRIVFPLPPRTTNLSSNVVSQENVLSEENFISMIGRNDVVEIDDDDDDEGGIDLSLSL